MLHPRSLSLALVLAALLGAAAPAEATNGLKLTSYGSRSAGRAGVDYAYADDGTGPATNPAGMGFTWGNRLDSNWALVMPRVEWKNRWGTFENTEKVYFPVPAFSLGMVFDPDKDWEVGNVFDLGRWGLFDEQPAAGEEEPVAPIPGDPATAPAEGAPAEEAAPPEPAGPVEFTDQELYGSKLKIGFGVFPVGGGKINMEDMYTGDPTAVNPTAVPFNSQPVDWQTDAEILAIAPSFAYRPTKHFAFGMTLQLLMGRLEVDGGIAQPAYTLRSPFNGTTQAVRPEVWTVTDVEDTRLGPEGNNGYWGLAVRLGMMYRADRFAFGLTYQSESWGTDYLGRVQVDATDQVNNIAAVDPTFLSVLGINPSLGYTSNYDLRIQGFKLPRQVGLGVSFRATDWLSLGLDYTFINWSVTNKTFKTRLTHGDNANLDLMSGTTLRVRVPQDFADQHVVAVGATFRVFEGEDLVPGVPSSTLLWRFGYNYGKNPVPDETTLPQQPAIVEHHLATGFTFRWGPLLELTGAVEWGLPNTVNTGPRHKADLTLSESKQTMELWFFHFGLGVNF